MTTVPDDVRAKAAQICNRILFRLDEFCDQNESIDPLALVAEALMQERERCAKIAASHYNLTHDDRARFAGAKIADAIRTPDPA